MFSIQKTGSASSSLGWELSDSDSDECHQQPSPVKQKQKIAKKSVSKRDLSDSDDSDDTVDYYQPEQEEKSDAEDKCGGPSEVRKDEDVRPVCKYDTSGSEEDEKESPPHKKQRRESKTNSCPDILTQTSPLSFLLTKVTGIADHHNSLAVHIKDILSSSMGELVASVQFNYMIDIPWLMQQYPQEYKNKPLLIVHGAQREQKQRLHEEAFPFSNVKLCQARIDMPYGTHHSKMMLLLYTNGLRVVIHTANLIDRDWAQKTQGVWISPLFPKLQGNRDPSTGDSRTRFKRDLLEYLNAYRAKQIQEWQQHVQEHDMSEAKVFIIGSVPGRHTDDRKVKWGHLKLRNVLKNHGPEGSFTKNWPVIGQFSSIGSLGAKSDSWLCGEWLESLGAVKGRGSLPFSNRTKLQLIFPCIDNVRLSLEGYVAGGSIPYSVHTAKKQQYLNTFLHQWKSSRQGRSRASPHIKTYCRLSPDELYLAWFLVTSANLSKAAWGVFEKNNSQLMIRSYEIGVLFLPSNFGCREERFTVEGMTSSEDQLSFPLPWDVPLTPYSPQDRPWLWDIPYTNKPDSHGNAWDPI